MYMYYGHPAFYGIPKKSKSWVYDGYIILYRLFSRLFSHPNLGSNQPMGTPRLGSHGSLWRPPGTAQSWYARSDRSHRCCQCCILNQWDFHRFSRKNGWIPLNSTIIPAIFWKNGAVITQPIQVLFGMISAVSTSISHSGLGAHCYRNSTGPYRVPSSKRPIYRNGQWIIHPQVYVEVYQWVYHFTYNFLAFANPSPSLSDARLSTRSTRPYHRLPHQKYLFHHVRNSADDRNIHSSYVWDYRITNRIHDKTPAVWGSSHCWVAIDSGLLFFHILRQLRGTCGVKHGHWAPFGLSDCGQRQPLEEGTGSPKNGRSALLSKRSMGGTTEVQMKFRRPNDWMTQRKRCCRSVGCRVRDFDLLPNRWEVMFRQDNVLCKHPLGGAAHCILRRCIALPKDSRHVWKPSSKDSVKAKLAKQKQPLE